VKRRFFRNNSLRVGERNGTDRTPQEFYPADMSSVTQVGPIEEDLTKIEYLGSGAFSNVVYLVGSQGEFIKMPKSGALAESLEHEAAF
jgi:hypothetical protein